MNRPACKSIVDIRHDSLCWHPSIVAVLILPMLRNIDRVILRVEGLESAVRYYRDVLGLKLIRHDSRLAAFKLGDSGGAAGAREAELILHSDPDLPYEEIYYAVDDVRDLYRRRGELKLRFVSQPQQIARGYRATVKDPFGTVLNILDRTTESAATAGTVEDAKSAGSLFPGVEPIVAPKRDVLIKTYAEVGRTADDLPYTPHFEKLHAAYAAAHGEPKPTRRETWRHLLNLRKAAKLPKLGDARSDPPDVPPEAIEQLKQLIGEKMGRRDRLPYTDEFDKLVDAFNQTQSKPLSPHLVWRVVARLAK
jgi:catechol 2,3-dioxygenase-like lactoylglutathione lyase family enzyme